MGIAYLTRIGFPSCVPGFHFGIAFITRIASPTKASTAFISADVRSDNSMVPFGLS